MNNLGTADGPSQLTNRVKSFLWRLGAYLIVAGISFLVANIGEFGLNPTVVAVIGLVAGEVTKVLNKQFNLEERVAGAMKR